MRKETQSIADAWRNREPLKKARTHTDGNAIWLHNNKIVWRDGDETWISMCGWPTSITRERINAVMPAHMCIAQRRGEQWLMWKDKKVVQISPDWKYSFSELKRFVPPLMRIGDALNIKGLAS